ncbi:MAG: hypothetical protein CMP59_10220 [Flavobacteriales bacterium]|nr:hypothetical protein [Flavobacteriales bacterium]|tara:strand:- start:3771 stop:5186 length:1416 start_codon:yes stop_codon:yes gene_type:complete
MKFDSVKAIENYYSHFQNWSLESIYKHIKKEFPEVIINTNKGAAGQVLEGLVGNSPNSNPNPDIGYLGLELKALPIRKVGNAYQPKERSKIKSINYNQIIEEEWVNSNLKNKLDKVLFLIYEHPIGKSYKDWKEFKFKYTLLYELESESPSVVQEDWEGIKYKVKSDKADELSEGDSTILGASTSGSGKPVKYGNNKSAKPRSYSLKHSYLKNFYDRKVKRKKYYSLEISKDLKTEDYLIEKINHHLEGKTLDSIGEEYDVTFSKSSKSSFRFLINQLLGFSSNQNILDIDLKGIEIKTVPVNSNYNLWEAMSFPKFSLVDLLDEEWDGEIDSVFRNLISKTFIFIPVIKEKIKVKAGTKPKFKHWKTWKIGRSVVWKASNEEMSIIKKEWEFVKRQIETGIEVKSKKHGEGYRQENNLLKSSQSQIIHVRPHAKDSNDIDIPFFEYTEEKIRISWQSFWLNKKFIAAKLK